MLRNAKLEAMGKPPVEPKPRHDRPQMATDEIVRLVGPHRRYTLIISYRSWSVSENGCVNNPERGHLGLFQSIFVPTAMYSTVRFAKLHL